MDPRKATTEELRDWVVRDWLRINAVNLDPTVRQVANRILESLAAKPSAGPAEVAPGLGELWNVQRAADGTPVVDSSGKPVRSNGRSVKPIDPKWFTIDKVCPRCNERKNVGRDFGIVTWEQTERPQSYCRACRTKYASKYRHEREEKESKPTKKK